MYVTYESLNLQMTLLKVVDSHFPWVDVVTVVPWDNTTYLQELVVI